MKNSEAKLKLLNNKIVSLVDLSATVWDKGTCLAEHDHLENYKHCWFKDKIKGLESKAEVDIKICTAGSPEGEEVCIPVKRCRKKLLHDPGHSCPFSIHSSPGRKPAAVCSSTGGFSLHPISGGDWRVGQ